MHVRWMPNQVFGGCARAEVSGCQSCQHRQVIIADRHLAAVLDSAIGPIVARDHERDPTIAPDVAVDDAGGWYRAAHAAINPLVPDRRKHRAITALSAERGDDGKGHQRAMPRW